MHRPAKRVLLVILAIFAGLGQMAWAGWSIEGSRTVQGPGLLYLEMRVAGNGSSGGRSVIRLVLPDPKRCSLRVVDNPGGQLSLGRAMEESGCLAGVNGGYFRADFTPVGLEITKGTVIHPKESAKLITGMVVVSRGRVAILRAGEYKPSPAITEALQCGPFLLDREKPVLGLNATKRAYRTVVISDGKGGFGLLMAESVTLAEMAQILATPNLIPGMKINRALNLDGGTSTGLWVREPALYQREFKRVRNFLAVVPR